MQISQQKPFYEQEKLQQNIKTSNPWGNRTKYQKKF